MSFSEFGDAYGIWPGLCCNSPVFTSKHGNKGFCIQQHLGIQKLLFSFALSLLSLEAWPSSKSHTPAGWEEKIKLGQKTSSQITWKCISKCINWPKNALLIMNTCITNMNRCIILHIFFSHRVIKLNTSEWVVNPVYAYHVKYLAVIIIDLDIGNFLPP